jgi:putative ubiquitin-RnfH superfamily antitoxin RatB of RatAB toxin-antitoxin module
MLIESLKEFSVNAFGRDLVEISSDIGIIEGDIPFYETRVGILEIVADEKHNHVYLNLIIDFKKINKDNITNIAKWVLESNQKVKLGCFKLTDDLDYLVYTNGIYTKDVQHFDPELITNMLVISEGMLDAYLDSYKAILE